ncbi:H-2 class II histocompatibility antigen, A-U alpha chain-like [Polymixia lowei]
MFGLHMSLFVIILIITGAVCTSIHSPYHELHYIYGCYDSGDVRVDVLIDGDQVLYADFNKQTAVWTLPRVPPVKDWNIAYSIAKATIAHCHRVLNKAKLAEPGVPTKQEAPEISIYSRYKAEHGVDNTLFCLVSHFYPPSINVTWTRNSQVVTEGASHLRYHSNKDGTFHRISRLDFTPEKGDVYYCHVEHQALESPLYRTWELEVRETSVSPGLVFFGVSLVLGLAGLGTGTFFLIKQPAAGF